MSPIQIVVRASSAAKGLISMPCRISGPDARHGHAEPERLAIEDGAPFDVLDALQREIEEIARAAGRVENAQGAEPVDEGVALGLGLGARRRRSVCRALALAVRPPPPAAASAGAMIASILAFAVVPLGAQRAQHDRLDDHHDLFGVGVMGADLRALVGIEKALEQRAENRRVDQAPVEARGGEQEADFVVLAARAAGVRRTGRR